MEWQMVTVDMVISVLIHELAIVISTPGKSEGSDYYFPNSVKSKSTDLFPILCLFRLLCLLYFFVSKIVTLDCFPLMFYFNKTIIRIIEILKIDILNEIVCRPFILKGK